MLLESSFGSKKIQKIPEPGTDGASDSLIKVVGIKITQYLTEIYMQQNISLKKGFTSKYIY